MTSGITRADRSHVPPRGFLHRKLARFPFPGARPLNGVRSPPSPDGPLTVCDVLPAPIRYSPAVAGPLDDGGPPKRSALDQLPLKQRVLAEQRGFIVPEADPVDDADDWTPAGDRKSVV